MTKATALSIARAGAAAGNSGSATRSTTSTALEEPAPGASDTGRVIQSRTCSGGVRNSSGIATPRGLRARGFSAISTSSGTITVRDQYDTLLRWKGNQRGSSMISTGITGTARHGT